MTKQHLIILVVFGVVFTVETSDEYRTITPEMLKEQMPQSTQLFQPNLENSPEDSYNQYGNPAPSNYNSHQNHHNQSPQATFANYGYWVRHEGQRDAMHRMPMHQDYNPENIAPGRAHRMTNSQPESYDYDEMPHYPHRHRSRYYYDPENHHHQPMNRHTYHEHIPPQHHLQNRHPYDEMPMMNYARHRRMPKPHAFNSRRKFRRVRRKPTIRGYVYGFPAAENDV